MSPRLLYVRRRLMSCMTANYLDDRGLTRDQVMQPRRLDALTRFAARKDIP